MKISCSALAWSGLGAVFGADRLLEQAADRGVAHAVAVAVEIGGDRQRVDLRRGGVPVGVEPRAVLGDLRRDRRQRFGQGCFGDQLPVAHRLVDAAERLAVDQRQVEGLGQRDHVGMVAVDQLPAHLDPAARDREIGAREDPPAEPPARFVEPGRHAGGRQRPQRRQAGDPAADDGDLAAIGAGAGSQRERGEAGGGAHRLEQRAAADPGDARQRRRQSRGLPLAAARPLERPANDR